MRWTGRRGDAATRRNADTTPAIERSAGIRRNGSAGHPSASPRLPVSASPVLPSTHHPPPEDVPSRLARAFQAGDRTVLAALHQELRPLMAQALFRYRARPGAEPRALPTTLESGDLAQQSWLILADLAELWRPAGGSFGAYFRVSFPWALARYVRRHSPNRRSKVVRVLGAERPDVQEKIDSRSGADGREWDANLSWAELLENLTERERAVLVLHLGGGKTFTDLAQALRLTRPAAYRLYRRALKRVQGSSVRVGSKTVFLDPESLNLERRGDLVQVVRALHDSAQADGCLPGLLWLATRTGLPKHRLARLLSLLAEAGCVRERAPRHSGRLVHTSPEETLAVLGIRGGGE